MTVQDRATEQVSVALEYVQGKRRVERVLEAATALVDRYAEEPEPSARLRDAVELIRRNFAAEVSLTFPDLQLGTGLDSTQGDADLYELTLHGADGASGSFQARYSASNPLLLTVTEWQAAIRLLVGIAATAAGGRVTGRAT